MADTIVERLITQLVFDGDVAEFERAESAVGGLSAAAFAAVAAMSALAASTAAEITVFRRLSSGLGVTTQDAREIAAVFATTGAEINDVSDALQTLSDYSLEAMNGNQTWVDTFKQIGVAAADLKGKKPDELLEVVADGFERTGDVVKRAATASQLFGDDVGRKLLPLLIKGSHGIRDMRMEAQLFGGVLTEEDAIAAENLTHDLRLLGYMVDGLKTRIGVGLMPVLQDLVGDTLEWVDANKDWLGLKIGQTVDFLTASFRLLTSPLGLVVGGIGGLYAAKTAASAVGTLAKALGFGELALGAAVGGLTTAAVLPALVALIGQDLYFAMQGLPSVTGDAAKALGKDSEFQIALIGARDLLRESSDFAIAFAGAIKSLAESPDLPDWMLTLMGNNPNVGTEGGLLHLMGVPKQEPFMTDEEIDTGAAILMERAAGGYAKASRYLASNDAGVRNAALSQVGFSAGAALLDPYGITGLSGPNGLPNAIPAMSEAWNSLGPSADESFRNSAYYGNMGAGRGDTNITVNANGLNAAEAEALARRVIQTEVSEAYDNSNGGTR